MAPASPRIAPVTGGTSGLGAPCVLLLRRALPQALELKVLARTSGVRA